jgi:hypothetical protein
MKFYYFL